MIATKDRVKDVRSWFRDLKERQERVIDKSGCRMLEVVGATFIADEPAIFGTPNRDYIAREIEWYRSQSLNVNDIPGGPPAAWKACADPEGLINSNYGWVIWSEENHDQYEHVKHELSEKPESRRAEMIYTRPSIWNEYNHNGMNDFVCTDSAQYFIRNNELVVDVRMRSNDVWAGYRNDVAWQKYVQQKLADDLSVPVGPMLWHAGSLHIYERNFYLIDHFAKTGEITIAKSAYRDLYPNSLFNSKET